LHTCSCDFYMTRYIQILIETSCTHIITGGTSTEVADIFVSTCLLPVSILLPLFLSSASLHHCKSCNFLLHTSPVLPFQVIPAPVFFFRFLRMTASRSPVYVSICCQVFGCCGWYTANIFGDNVLLWYIPVISIGIRLQLYGRSRSIMKPFLFQDSFNSQFPVFMILQCVGETE
jgi:hypothetical protein